MGNVTHLMGVLCASTTYHLYKDLAKILAVMYDLDVRPHWASPCILKSPMEADSLILSLLKLAALSNQIY